MCAILAGRFLMVRPIGADSGLLAGSGPGGREQLRDCGGFEDAGAGVTGAPQPTCQLWGKGGTAA